MVSMNSIATAQALRPYDGIYGICKSNNSKSPIFTMLTKKDHSASTHNAIKEKALLNELRIAQISSYCALIVTGIATAIGFYGIILVLKGQITIGTVTSIGSFLATNGFCKMATKANQRVDRLLKEDQNR
jgi:hypothetical protein